MAFGYQVKAVDTVLSMYPEITRYILGTTYTVAIQKAVHTDAFMTKIFKHRFASE
jgi:hypothetical protein